jgi:hypothetical protein
MVRVALICIQVEGKHVWQLGHRYKWGANGRKKTGERLNINTTYLIESVSSHNHYYDGMQWSPASMYSILPRPLFIRSILIFQNKKKWWCFMLKYEWLLKLLSKLFWSVFYSCHLWQIFCCGTSILFQWHKVLNWWAFIPCNIE